MKIYQDLDGVILEKDLTIPDYGKEFISFLVANHYCYWLSTHWTDLKTEAIDLNSDFIWLEDYPFEPEKIVLKKVNRI